MAAAAVVMTWSATASAGPTLDAVKQKGFVQCGVNTGLGGFSIADSKGRWVGLDVDICRAVAAAILGDGDKIKFTPLSAQQRFTALQSGEVDILSRNTTWTLTRDTKLGLNFAGVTFYDGQGFMVRKDLGVKSAKELNGATICVQPGTTTELNLADYFRAQGMQFEPVVIEAQQEVVSAFFSGRCDVFTTDASGLASVRTNDAPNPDDYMILPEIISKEPLGPAVRHGDDEWFDIVKWVIYALLEAEEQGITAANVDSMMDSKNPVVQRLLGATPGNGAALGLDEAWATNAIKAVGNYGEIYERNIVPLGLSRGVNALWTKGGLMYAMPAR
ncbi:MAG: amino acid ABC transporter substrate-binding protein [Rhodobacterales bacterium]|nr:amino acid ABC transporter substrate-binding protein [Rhodobacterales bacterium]